MGNKIRQVGQAYNKQVAQDEEDMRSIINNPLGRLQQAIAPPPPQRPIQPEPMSPVDAARSEAVLKSIFAPKQQDLGDLKMQLQKEAQDKADEEAMNELNENAVKRDNFQKIRQQLK